MKPATRNRLQRFFRRKYLNDDADTMIELAICLPVAMLMTLGFIYFAMLVMGMGSNAFASRAALRYASIHSATSHTPATQAALNAIILNYVIPYPSNTYTLNTYYFNSNSVGQAVEIVLAVNYTVSIYGATYTPITFTWTTAGWIIE